jgi:TPR repeat protein
LCKKGLQNKKEEPAAESKDKNMCRPPSWSPRTLPGLEVCPICEDVTMYTETNQYQNAVITECCCKAMCLECLHKVPYELGCPFCRAPFEAAEATIVKRIMARAEAGDKNAQFNLASYHDFGKNGLPVNKKQAIKWNTKAAEQGHVRAQMNLAMTYREGDGTAVDKEQAAHWFKAAAQLGLLPAMTEWARALLTGNGVQRNEGEAKVWLERARAGGDPVAVRMMMCMGK